ncbi:hypothetical protein [Geodermatophilus sp. URMC 63]
MSEKATSDEATSDELMTRVTGWGFLRLPGELGRRQEAHKQAREALLIARGSVKDKRTVPVDWNDGAATPVVEPTEVEPSAIPTEAEPSGPSTAVPPPDPESSMRSNPPEVVPPEVKKTRRLSKQEESSLRAKLSHRSFASLMPTGGVEFIHNPEATDPRLRFIARFAIPAEVAASLADQRSALREIERDLEAMIEVQSFENVVYVAAANEKAMNRAVDSIHRLAGLNVSPRMPRRQVTARRTRRSSGPDLSR